MSALAIDSPRGQAHEIYNEIAWDVIMDHFFGATCQRTHKSHPADGVVHYPSGKPCLLVEIKSRREFKEGYPFAVREFFENPRFGGKWLVTHEKLRNCAAIADQLRIPFIGALHSPNDKVVLLKALYRAGKWLVDVERRRSTTRETINGGSAERWNGYVPMQGATVLRYT